MPSVVLTKSLILDHLKAHKLMSIATYGDHPWIATVYYSFDEELHLYFLSSPDTLHAKHIAQNPHVAVSIADSAQKPSAEKVGLQLHGIVEQLGKTELIRHALRHWKDSLSIQDPTLTYENMVKSIVKGRMYKITPKKIKFFNESLFDVEVGHEPILTF